MFSADFEKKKKSTQTVKNYCYFYSISFILF